jgi:hypothetical protein
VQRVVEADAVDLRDDRRRALSGDRKAVFAWVFGHAGGELAELRVVAIAVRQVGDGVAGEEVRDRSFFLVDRRRESIALGGAAAAGDVGLLAHHGNGERKVDADAGAQAQRCASRAARLQVGSRGFDGVCAGKQARGAIVAGGVGQDGAFRVEVGVGDEDGSVGDRLLRGVERLAGDGGGVGLRKCGEAEEAREYDRKPATKAALSSAVFRGAAAPRQS